MDEHATRLLDMRARLGSLNAHELKACDWLLGKLEQGKIDHGPLDLDTDPRNWIREFMSEVADAIWYAAFQAHQNKPACAVTAGLRELRDAPIVAARLAWEGEP